MFLNLQLTKRENKREKLHLCSDVTMNDVYDVIMDCTMQFSTSSVSRSVAGVSPVVLPSKLVSVNIFHIANLFENFKFLSTTYFFWLNLNTTNQVFRYSRWKIELPGVGYRGHDKCGSAPDHDSDKGGREHIDATIVCSST